MRKDCAPLRKGCATAVVKRNASLSIARRKPSPRDRSAVEMKARHRAWKPPQPGYTHIVRAKYAAHVTSASLGAVTDGELKI